MDSQAVYFHKVQRLDSPFDMTSGRKDPGEVIEDDDGNFEKALAEISRIFDRKTTANKKEIAELKAEVENQRERIGQLEEQLEMKNHTILALEAELDQLKASPMQPIFER